MKTSLPLAQLLGLVSDAVLAVRGGRSLNDVLAACPAPARPGVQALGFEVLRRLGTALALRRLLAPKTPPPAVDALLLTAIALLLPQPADGAAAPPGDPADDGRPVYAPHTLVDQAVQAARQKKAASAGFVNAVLRRFVREREQLLSQVDADPQARHNHPPWWIERLRSDWPQHWQALLDANNRRPPLVLRVNRRRCNVADYLQRLDAAGLPAEALPLPGVDGEAGLADSAAIVVLTPVPVQRLPGFDSGDVSVQDAAAQLAAHLLLAAAPGLPPLPNGARVLDACAAPGGKTAHLLELAERPIDVLALDRDPQRLRRVDETLARLGLAARTLAADAAATADWWDGQPFDAILLDAPCSASGIVRRHPDIRWLRRASDIDALARTQAALLDALWPLLKPGGRLLYCTCSVFRAEGQQQIDAFLQRHADAIAVRSPRSPGHLLPLADNPQSGFAPAARSSDGFFHSLLSKR
ncbi:16S rRNA (cytosine(967)-C(5))-methyltransferase RsmB [Piscinibacter sakaiensis]|uniref:16S rRNA (cytosine(967)-C(5))-methyltransferase RsmB n=1 Tax=Piscinibacter sakaiensis TaxID=1547922 RepID=UPI003AAF86A6